MVELRTFRDTLVQLLSAFKRKMQLHYLYTACLAYCINLSLQEAAQKVKSVREGLNLAMDVIQLIKLSPKQQVLLENIQSQEESSANSGIRSLCPTRWTVCTGVIQTILNNCESLQMHDNGCCIIWNR